MRINYQDMETKSAQLENLAIEFWEGFYNIANTMDWQGASREEWMAEVDKVREQLSTILKTPMIKAKQIQKIDEEIAERIRNGNF